jgi:hypothetical protein
LLITIAGAFATSLLAACGTVDLNTLIAIVDADGLPYKITACQRPTAAGKMFADFLEPHEIAARVGNSWAALPPPLRDDTVIRAVLAQAQYIPLNLAAVAPAYSQSRPLVDEPTAPVLQITPPASQLTLSDFYRLASLVSEYTRQPAPSGSSIPDPFLQILGKYYQAYYAGKFRTYFNAKYDQPVISLTVNDNEITQSVNVLFELIFDTSLNSPVWLGADKKTYYPGGTTDEPTVAMLNYQAFKQPVGPLPVELPNGCHMTELKAKIINYVAQRFATAASSDTALTVKSAGGLGISLGVFGKLSLGDNSTLTLLIKSVVSEVTLRLTAFLAYTTLSQVEIVTPKGFMSEAAQVRALSNLFVSPNRRLSYAR